MRTQIDKEEAERLARAIQKAPVDWIKVQEITFDPVALTYELKCAYRQKPKGLFHTQGGWTTLQLKSPRQWIDLLIKHRDDLELP